ncbi:DUF1444 family protein [Chondromyces apiculatus]|uniref:Uncharacterized protein n=1 Tax=Chondromyces apiculatus DSM 436 TaxID=1192034 RepID=A0A017SZ12_9BACT|nr:DUF1444 family protein [Chondromyces apiculatus]EYF02229.1 Hypothetical protein CAP_7301 [Chondromyces apiculatus DSM 436]
MGFWDRLRGRPTRDDYAQMIIKAMRKKGEDRPIRYEPEGFKLRIGDDSPAISWLANGYDAYLQAPRSRRRAILQRYALGPTPSLADVPLAEILPRLLPRIRDRFFYTALPLRLQIEGISAPRSGLYRPVAEHLALGLVQDLPEHIVEVPEDVFATWNISFEEALHIARENLRALSAEPFERVHHGVYLSPWRDNHDAARLILTDTLRRLLVRGDPVVMVAHRDALIVTGTDDIQGLDVLAALTESYMEDNRAITTIPVCLLDDDTWAPFIPEQGHPLHARFAALRIATLTSEYERQKHLLDALHKEQGNPIFVASHKTRIRDDDDEMRSYCAWTRGVSTLLPHADDLVLVDPDAPEDTRTLLCPWSRATELLGDRMIPVDLYPPRYRVDTFPTDAELAALRKDAS